MGRRDESGVSATTSGVPPSGVLPPSGSEGGGVAPAHDMKAAAAAAAAASSALDRMATVSKQVRFSLVFLTVFSDGLALCGLVGASCGESPVVLDYGVNSRCTLVGGWCWGFGTYLLEPVLRVYPPRELFHPLFVLKDGSVRSDDTQVL